MRKPEIKKNIIVDPTIIPQKYFWVGDFKNLILIDNTKVEATNSGCKSGINAFYYDINNKPLGWLIINGNLVNRGYKSRLLDGFVYTLGEKFLISTQEPNLADFGHQSGPLLTSNLNNVVRDRRSVAIQTNDDKAVFAYFEEATLAELLQKVNDLGKKEGFEVKNAINLDGGRSASFWTENTRVYETFKTGGWWCDSAENRTPITGMKAPCPSR